MNAILEALGNLGFDWHVALANTVNFLIIFFLLKYFFFGKIQAVLAERATRIREGLDAAKEAQQKLLSAEEEKKAIVVEAHTKAESIAEKALQDAKEVARVIEKAADQKAALLITRAEGTQMRLEAEYEDSLKKKIPLLAIAMAESILREKMTEEENKKYIIKLLAQ